MADMMTLDHNDNVESQAQPMKNRRKTAIDIKKAPIEMQDFLKEFDVDGSGTVDVDELGLMARRLKEEKKEKDKAMSLTKHMIVALIFSLFVFAGLSFSTAYLGSELAKETKVQGSNDAESNTDVTPPSNLLMNKDNDEPVAVTVGKSKVEGQTVLNVLFASELETGFEFEHGAVAEDQARQRLQITGYVDRIETSSNGTIAIRTFAVAGGSKMIATKDDGGCVTLKLEPHSDSIYEKFENAFGCDGKERRRLFEWNFINVPDQPTYPMLFSGLANLNEQLNEQKEMCTTEGSFSNFCGAR